MNFTEVAQHIIATPSTHKQQLIAIDGGGGAGKSTFAQHVQQALPGSVIVAIDTFYKPPQLRVPVESFAEPNPNFDWDRFEQSILKAVENGEPLQYQTYDFQEGSLTGDIVEIPSDATIIVEGVWSMQSAFLPYYDFCIWLEAPAAFRLERGVARDGEALRVVWEEEWIPIDETYKAIEEPHLHADVIVDSYASDFTKDLIIPIETSHDI